MFKPTAALNPFRLLDYSSVKFNKRPRLCKLAPRYIPCYVQSAASTAQVMILLAGASVLSWILTIGHVPQQLTNLITANNLSAWQFLLAINIILLIAGMFIDGSSAIIILAPLVYSIAVKLGINPVHLGVIMVANAAIGMFTPPFGLNLFVASSTAKLSLNRIFSGVGPFIIISIPFCLGELPH
ncbi:TRAP transporter large permease subunit [Moorella stamsii]|uniref:TRAP transporter large permease subunit n=1 Tax=Neomoorella stamsii TaxID=1266720 RepID=UPI0009FB0DFB|nr:MULTISPECIES: TRAP transporter large permease subunit [Moorella]